MPGTFVVDATNTFSAALFMASNPKLKFGSKTGEQEMSAAGLPKWGVQAAVTFHALNGMQPISEVITITVESPSDPCQGFPPGTPVFFDGFRVGISPPERNDKGGIRGGKAWYQAGSIRPADQRRNTAEAA
jgi:hypothetical protein